MKVRELKEKLAGVPSDYDITIFVKGRNIDNQLYSKDYEDFTVDIYHGTKDVEFNITEDYYE